MSMGMELGRDGWTWYMCARYGTGEAMENPLVETDKETMVMLMGLQVMVVLLTTGANV